MVGRERGQGGPRVRGSSAHITSVAAVQRLAVCPIRNLAKPGWRAIEGGAAGCFKRRAQGDVRLKRQG